MAKIERQYNAFVRGLITEAGPLTFPENASLDELNFVLNRNGTRDRRLGLDYEFNYILNNTGVSPDISAKAKLQFKRWDSPNGDSTTVLGIIRYYDRLWFVNLLSNNSGSNFINSGQPMLINGLSNSLLSFTIINNVMVLASPELNNIILLTFVKETGQIFQEEVSLLARDIWGVDDGLDPAERPSTLTNTHRYNLINQGWNTNIQVKGSVTVVVDTPAPTPKPVKSTGTGLAGIFSLSNSPATPLNQGQTSPISTLGFLGTIAKTKPTPTKTIPNPANAIDNTKAVLGVYPSNADIWTVGKVSDPSSADFEKYDPNVMRRNSVDNVYSPKASVIIDVYNRGSSRRNSTGLQDLPLDKERGRCSVVESYAGRVFYSGIDSDITGADIKSPNYNSYVFFSQTVTSNEKIGWCYQDADPTSPDINELIASDGGTIQIPEANKIIGLKACAASLLVFSENGVWEIYGDTGGFKATSYQLNKITSNGVYNPRTIVEVNGTVIYWGKGGIYLLNSDPISGRFKVENVSLNSIQTFYQNIPEVAKQNSVGFYEDSENRVRWLYNDLAGYGSTFSYTQYNKELVLDLSLKAFSPFEHSSSPTQTPVVCDYINVPNYSTTYLPDTVVVGNDPVILTNLDDVSTTIATFIPRASSFKFLTLVGTSFTFSQYNNLSFFDWQLFNSTGYDYTSYIVTGYDIAQDLMRNKQTPYIFVFFKKTENGFDADAGGGFTFSNPSGCILQAQWNWHNSAAGNRWGTPFQAYRLTKNYTPSGVDDNFDTGEDVIVTKNKLRGSGKSLSLKFSSESGKDMKLLGWSYPFVADNVP